MKFNIKNLLKIIKKNAEISFFILTLLVAIISTQFYNNQKELTSIIEESCVNPGKYIEMGKKAQEYYRSNATIKHMAQGFIDAIQYTLK